jgi:hypothetical protein
VVRFQAGTRHVSFLKCPGRLRTTQPSNQCAVRPFLLRVELSVKPTTPFSMMAGLGMYGTISPFSRLAYMCVQEIL